VLLLGEYEFTIDSKQRLAIPAEIRSALKPELHGDGFIVAPGSNGTLWLWPERTFEQMASALGQSLLNDEDMMEFEREMFSQAAKLGIDTAGRVRIPERLLRQYELGNDVVILGVRDHLEIMDPKQWATHRQAQRPRQTEIWRRARQALRDQQNPGGV
jgi:MraZ protein